MTIKYTQVFAGLFLVGFIAGCSYYSPVYGDKDSKSYHIYCGGEPYASTGDCHDRAQSVCSPNGYTVVSENDPQYVHTQTLWDVSTHDMVVRCAPPMVKETSQPVPDIAFTEDQARATPPNVRAAPAPSMETFDQYPSGNKDWQVMPSHSVSDSP